MTFLLKKCFWKNSFFVWLYFYRGKIEVNINVNQRFRYWFLFNETASHVYLTAYCQSLSFRSAEPGNFVTSACIASTMRNVVLHISASLT